MHIISIHLVKCTEYCAHTSVGQRYLGQCSFVMCFYKQHYITNRLSQNNLKVNVSPSLSSLRSWWRRSASKLTWSGWCSLKTDGLLMVYCGLVLHFIHSQPSHCTIIGITTIFPNVDNPHTPWLQCSTKVESFKSLANVIKSLNDLNHFLYFDICNKKCVEQNRTD